MAKKIIRDIIIKKKTTKFRRPNPPQVRPQEIPKIPQEETYQTNDKKNALPKVLFSIVAIIVIGFLIKISLNNFSYATINITPHQELAQTNSKLTAHRGAQGGDLGFEIMQLEKEMSQKITATGFSDGGQTASGKVVIFNTFSSKSQKLITKTRFETSDGKIYRIKSSITVPGFGSTEATVYAEEPGPEYNIGLTDFTIPGLKGDARYEKIYARSKTEISGGSNAGSQIVTKKDISEAKKAIQEQIEIYLKKTLLKQKPDDYILYDRAIQIEIIGDPNNLRAGDGAETFTFKLAGKVTGFLIKKENLSQEIANDYISDKTNVSVANLDELTFTLLSKNTDNTEIEFSLQGESHFVWGFDEAEITSKLIQEKGDYDNVFKYYPHIEKAEIVFKPGWWQKMPKRESHIFIETILE